jgi:long-chain acyl-CoA synthetase
VYPRVHAATSPDKAALIMATSGEVVTYRELDDRSCRLARLLWGAGLRAGDHVAIFMENHPRYFEVAWAALRSGLYLTPVSSYLTADEAAYVVNDCQARALVTSAAHREVAERIVPDTPGVEVRLMVGTTSGAPVGHEPYDDAIGRYPSAPLDDEPLGDLMFYSSGTTGRPKGIKRPLTGRNAREGNVLLVPLLQSLYGVGEDTVYLSPAPLYHAAPLTFSVGVQAFGGTVVVMERFDAAQALALIERHRVTHGQFVPTMFVRMLNLPEDERRRHDLSSLRVAVHAAAPCPVPAKEQMIAWWGPVLVEYYAGTEGNGVTFIGSEEWLDHRGSVGRSLGAPLHICDEAGEELRVGETGLVYFDSPTGLPFEYHNDPAKTRGTLHPRNPNWSTLGDVGHLDEDGFLYLTDRRAYMIICGGVNIYPQEVENSLVMHPAVMDAAVFGVPHDDMGEQVKAVVQPAPGVEAGAELERQLIAYCREHLAAVKCPRSIDFAPALPRLPTGKLYKRLLRDPYWEGREVRI